MLPGVAVRPVRRLMGVCALAVLVCGVLVAPSVLGARVPATHPAARPRLAAPSASWTTYHHDNQRGGYDSQQPALSSIALGWASPTTVDADVYAEPLVVGGSVYVATENNTVYSLSATTGSIQWQTHLGTPVSVLPCGNIDPEGITGTPVIDPSAGVLYVVALVQPSGQAMHHELDALDITTGAVNFRETLSVSGIDPKYHLQRGALTLLNNTVYIPFGGRYGDCTPSHGWMVAAPTSGSGPLTAFQTSTDLAGGFWQPAGASVDASGNLYDTSGNTFCGSPCTFDGGETVFKLSPSLQELDYFAPSNFATLDANDLDLGSTNPLPVNGGLIFQIGKTGDGFLLRQSNLGQVGGQAYTAHACPGLNDDAAFGGDAYVDPYIYVPCASGLVALTLNSSAPSFSFAWQGPAVSYAGPPIVDGGLVWTLDPAGTLYALNPTTGAVVYSYNVGSAAHFATPAAGDGAVFVAANTHIYSFVGGASAHLAATPTALAAAQAPNSQTQQPLTISNPGTGPLNWTVSGVPSWLSLSATSGTVAPGAHQDLTATFDSTGMAVHTTQTATLTFADPHADNGSVAVPVTLAAVNVSTHWYFAEGTTGGSFQTYLSIANPNGVAANVTIQYFLDNGSTPHVDVTVPANNRLTENVNTDIGTGHAVSMTVTSTNNVGVVAERPMYFTYHGIPGGTDVLGATSLSSNFAFGYVDTTANHTTFFTILNPNAGPSNAMDAQLTLYPAAGGTPISFTKTIAPSSRGTINVNTEVPSLPAGSYSATITLVQHGAGTPTPLNGLVERPLYLIDSASGYTGSADVIGVSGTQPNWYFAEGATGGTFFERYILSNPCLPAASGGCGSTPTANPTVTFYKPDGTTGTASVQLLAGQQKVVNVNSVLGQGVSNSAAVTSDHPILAERFMSFSYHGIPGATDVLGANAPSSVFDFAEGSASSDFTEFLTIENPTSQTATVVVTFLPAGGTAFGRVYTVAANSRFTLKTNDVVTPGSSFSLSVEANVPIVAERPMYFTYHGSDTGGTDIIGYQP